MMSNTVYCFILFLYCDLSPHSSRTIFFRGFFFSPQVRGRFAEDLAISLLIHIDTVCANYSVCVYDLFLAEHRIDQE